MHRPRFVAHPPGTMAAATLPIMSNAFASLPTSLTAAFGYFGAVPALVGFSCIAAPARWVDRYEVAAAGQNSSAPLRGAGWPLPKCSSRATAHARSLTLFDDGQRFQKCTGSFGGAYRARIELLRLTLYLWSCFATYRPSRGNQPITVFFATVSASYRLLRLCRVGVGWSGCRRGGSSQLAKSHFETLSALSRMRGMISMNDPFA
jgi:hypothetical protein